MPKKIIINPQSKNKLLDVHPATYPILKRRAPTTISATPPYCLRVTMTLNALLLLLRSDELITLTVDIDDLYLTVVLQVLAQLSDIHIH